MMMAIIYHDDAFHFCQYKVSSSPLGAAGSTYHVKKCVIAAGIYRPFTSSVPRNYTAQNNAPAAAATERARRRRRVENEYKAPSVVAVDAVLI